MTLKDFHDGSIPIDLPLTSTHGGSIPTDTEREREREREREVFAARVGGWVFRSFGLVPLKQKSHGRHVIVLFVQHSSEFIIRVQSVTLMVIV